jgi:hypothetical protein
MKWVIMASRNDDVGLQFFQAIEIDFFRIRLLQVNERLGKRGIDVLLVANSGFA